MFAMKIVTCILKSIIIFTCINYLAATKIAIMNFSIKLIVTMHQLNYILFNILLSFLMFF